MADFKEHPAKPAWTQRPRPSVGPAHNPLPALRCRCPIPPPPHTHPCLSPSRSLRIPAVAAAMMEKVHWVASGQGRFCSALWSTPFPLDSGVQDAAVSRCTGALAHTGRPAGMTRLLEGGCLWLGWPPCSRSEGPGSVGSRGRIATCLLGEAGRASQVGRGDLQGGA